MIIINILLASFLLVHRSYAFSAQDELSNDAIERYHRLHTYLDRVDASRILSPEKVALVILYSDYKHPTDPSETSLVRDLYQLKPLQALRLDTAFYYQAFKYIKKVVPIINIKKNKEQILNMIKNETTNQEVIILVYLGHGDTEGRLLLGSYDNKCENLYKECCSGNNKDLFAPPIFDHGRPGEMSATSLSLWNQQYQNKWISLGCNKYILSPEEFLAAPAFTNKHLVFINDSCYSGVSNKWLQPPMKMLIYSASSHETAVTKKANPSNYPEYDGSVPWIGGRMTTELRNRLTSKLGCDFDGKGKESFGNIANNDLVLNLAEWTYNFNKPLDIGNVKGRNSTTVTPGANAFSKTEQVLGLPVQTYTEEECSGKSNHNLVHTWQDLETKIDKYRRTINDELKNNIITWDKYSGMLSNGQYLGR